MDHSLSEQDIERRIRALAGKLSLEQKVRLLSGGSVWALPAEPAIGLRPIVMSDGPSGVRGQSWDDRETSASLPSATSVAATWDVELVGKLGELLASQARAKNVDVVLGPTVNLHRSPRGGRHFEAFSEDPWLSGVLGTAYVRGVQSRGVAATAKHYVANDSETDRMTVDVHVGERVLREVYLAPFERMVTEGDCWLVMSAYNQVNGTTMSANPLLRDPLKDEWEFDGVVVSDWTAVRDAIESGRSGQDLAMPGPQTAWTDGLFAAVREGQVPEAAIDDKVRRVLRLATRVGALDGVPAATPVPEEWPEPDERSLLREAAADGMVLVRNDGVLPCPTGSGPRIAVIGQHARRGRNQGGGSATVFPEHVISPLDGLRATYGADNVRFAPGLPPDDEVHPFERGTVTDPITGTEGVHVRYLDADGVAIAEETFPTGRFGWIGDQNLARAASIELTTRYMPQESGTRRVGFAALGHCSLDIDGEIVRSEQALPQDDNLIAAIMAPPTVATDVIVEAGQQLEIRMEFRPELPGGFPVARLVLGTQDIGDDAAGELDRAVTLAAESDLAIVVVGTTENIESEGIDRTTLSLPDGQDGLVRCVLAANPRTVVVVNSGGPVTMPWLEEVPAVLLSWFPGQEFGAALADVLSGLREPGGRSPTTWPVREQDAPVLEVAPTDGHLAYDEGVHIGHRAWLRRANPAPAIPFGHGLGYTRWRIGAAQVVDNPDGTITVTAAVTNTGDRSGKHVLQAYLSRPRASAVEYPERWLAGFALVRAEPGETVTARIDIEPRSLRHWSVEQHSWIQEPGAFAVRVGSSIADLGAPVEFEPRKS